MATQAGLEHIRQRIDDTTTLAELQYFWEQRIGKEYAKLPEVQAMKERRKGELSK